MTSKDWATLWKRAAKRQYHKTDRFLIAWMRTILLAGSKGRWALAWKRAAKLHRLMRRYWLESYRRALDKLDEQRGRYDALLAEHKALQELLEVSDSVWAQAVNLYPDLEALND